MKQQWKFAGRSTVGGVDFYNWKCDGVWGSKHPLIEVRRVSDLLGGRA